MPALINLTRAGRARTPLSLAIAFRQIHAPRTALDRLFELTQSGFRLQLDRRAQYERVEDSSKEIGRAVAQIPFEAGTMPGIG